MYICTHIYIKLNNFAVYLKLIQQCKLTIYVCISCSVMSDSLQPHGL